MSTQEKAKRKREYLFQMFEQEWICPISSVAIVDPVVTSDGHTYERSQITKWLKKEKTSPKTGLKLQKFKTLPNIALKSVIQKFNKQIKYQIEKIIKDNKQYAQKISQLQEQVKELNQKLQKQQQKNKNLLDKIEKHEKKQQEKRKRLLELKEINQKTSEKKIQLSSREDQNESESDSSSGIDDELLIQLQDYDSIKFSSKDSSQHEIEKSQKVQVEKKVQLNELIPLNEYLHCNPVLYDQQLKILDHSSQKINMVEFLKYDWSQLKQLNLEDTDINDTSFELLAKGIDSLKSLKKLNVAENGIICVEKSTMDKFANLQKIKFPKLAKGQKKLVTQLNSQTKLMLRVFSLSHPKVSVVY